VSSIRSLCSKEQVLPNSVYFGDTTKNGSICAGLSKNWLKKLHIKIVQFNFAAVIWMMTVPNYILISKH
jgi:hypothetical protein